MYIFNFLNNHSIILYIIKAITILLITSITVKLLGKWLKRREAANINTKFMYSIIKYAVYSIGIFIALGQFPEMSSISSTLLASSGVIALIISLAAQESFSNIFSGLMLSIFRPFNIGDRVKLISSNITGYIETITIRHTIIRTFTNSRIVIPNSVNE